MKKKTLDAIKEIERDCLELKKEGFLTTFGAGELEVINLIKELEGIKTFK